MAYLETDLRVNDGSGPMVHYMNVSEPVGEGCPNRHDDVALVQALLQSLGNLPESPVHPRQFPVNGVWHPELRRGLLLFQKLARRALRLRGAGEDLDADGIVVPADAVYYGDLRMFTIVALNKAYAHYYWPDYLQKWPLQLATRFRTSPRAEAPGKGASPRRCRPFAET